VLSPTGTECAPAQATSCRYKLARKSIAASLKFHPKNRKPFRPPKRRIGPQKKLLFTRLSKASATGDLLDGEPMSEARTHLPSKDGEPAWEAAYFFPPQGRWSEADFLQFHTNRMAELVNGRLEILPMPTWLHQLILDFLLTEVKEHLKSTNDQGIVLFAPLPTKLFAGTIREPDILYVAKENLPGRGVKYPSNIDLAMEIVSEGTDARKRDYEDKRIDYAKAAVSEYWIVDPEQRVITVLGLHGESYENLGEFRAGQQAQGRYWPGFSISVDKVLALVDSHPDA
jgi:Uma2 family endonuclease